MGACNGSRRAEDVLILGLALAVAANSTVDEHWERIRTERISTGSFQLR